MPEVNVDIGDGLASVDIDQLDINVGVDTFLILADVPADVFTINV